MRICIIFAEELAKTDVLLRTDLKQVPS